MSFYCSKEFIFRVLYSPDIEHGAGFNRYGVYLQFITFDSLKERSVPVFGCVRIKKILQPSVERCSKCFENVQTFGLTGFGVCQTKP